MSLGVLPHVTDPRAAEQVMADYLAHERAKAMERQMPVILAVADVLGERLPEFRALGAEEQLAIAQAAVNAVEAGF